MAARSPGPPNRERRVVVQAVRKVVKPHSVDRATTTLWRDAERSLGQQRFEWSGEWVGSLRPAAGAQPAGRIVPPVGLGSLRPCFVAGEKILDALLQRKDPPQIRDQPGHHRLD